MSDAERFGELRSLLHQPAEPQLWRRLCELFDQWRDPVSLTQQAIPYAQDHLRRWDDALRVVWLSWLERARRGAPPPMLALTRSLDLRLREVPDDALVAIIGQPWTQTLRLMDLSMNRLGLDAARALARAPHLSQLHTLQLGYNALGDRGVIAISLSGALSGLRSLDMTRVGMQQDGAEALARSVFAGQLHALSLGANWLGEDGMVALGSRVWPALTALDLQENRIDQAGIEALAARAGWPALRRLDLRRNLLERAGARALAWWSAPPLVSLNVQDNQLGDAGVHHLLESSRWRALEELDLAENEVTAQGVLALTQALHLPNLRTLRLGQNALGPSAMQLWRADTLRALRVLELDRASLQDAGVEALCGWEGCATLHALELSENALTARACEALAGRAWPALRALNLRRNPLGDAGALALTRAPWPALEVLDLSRCELTERGRDALRASLDAPMLRQLRL